MIPLPSLRKRGAAVLCLGILLSSVLGDVSRADDPPSAVGAVMKLLKSGRVPESRLSTIVELVGTRGNEHDLAYLLDEISKEGHWPIELRRQGLDLLRDAAETRKVNPAGNLTALADLLKSPDDELRFTSITLAGLWKTSSAAGSIAALATATETDSRLRLAAFEALGRIDPVLVREAIEKVSGSEFPLEARMLATVAFSSLDPAAAAAQAVNQLKQATDLDDPSPLIGAFLDLEGGSKLLAESIGNAEIRPDVAKLALRHMYSIGRSDAELGNVLGKLVGINTNPEPPTKEEVAELVKEVEGQGSAERGELVFRRSDLSCMKCHAVSKAGGQIGPDLSALGASSPLDYIVTSVLDPDQAIKEAYITKLVVTLDGRIHQGLVVDRTNERLILKDANGKTVTVAVSDIEEEVEGKSLMPKGLVKFMTHAEFLDLARFLSSLGKPGRYEVRSTQRMQRWKYLTAPAPALIRDLPNDSTFEDPAFLTTGWNPIYAMVDGQLPLDEVVSATGHEVVYVQGQVDVTRSGKIQVQLDSTAGVNMWVDDRSVAISEAPVVDLAEGIHSLTFRVDLTSRDSRFLKLEVFKAPESAAEFHVVDGQ